ncbi:twin-arginine translocation signal domain-containing protein [Patescibacteria group bacterium]|nr:twin-arginine translocation signal domain-containing protein [Patescibacteria group bacterium]
MSLTRREFLGLSLVAIAGAVAGCSPRREIPVPQITAVKTPENNTSNIDPLWKESARSYKDQAFNSVYQQLRSGAYVGKSNIQEGRFIYLKDPSKKPFYESPDAYVPDLGPAYGEVVTFYREYQNPHLLWPLAQEYKMLGHLNVFVIGGYRDFPQEARTIKKDSNFISAEANVVKVLNNGAQQLTGLEIEEVHYDSKSRPIFRCTSQFNEKMVKISETNIKGKKLEEFYFIWPKSEK